MPSDAVPHLRWTDLPVAALPLGPDLFDPAVTFTCGQTFRWEPVEGAWIGVAGGHIVRLWQEGRWTCSQAYPPGFDLARYLWADFDLAGWAAAMRSRAPWLALALAAFPGLRVLRQDPEEMLFTFALATASHVPRITRMVRSLAAQLGAPIAWIDGRLYRAFPTAEALLAAPDDLLTGPCNLGYRARVIRRLAAWYCERGRAWLSDLAARPYAEAHRRLQEAPGVGPKVADCLCLFGLGFAEAVPIDAQTWKVARGLFGPALPTRTLTARTYRLAGDLFRQRYGPAAGWAQEYLYHAARTGRLAGLAAR